VETERGGGNKIVPSLEIGEGGKKRGGKKITNAILHWGVATRGREEAQGVSCYKGKREGKDYTKKCRGAGFDLSSRSGGKEEKGGTEGDYL